MIVSGGTNAAPFGKSFSRFIFLRSSRGRSSLLPRGNVGIPPHTSGVSQPSPLSIQAQNELCQHRILPNHRQTLPQRPVRSHPPPWYGSISPNESVRGYDTCQLTRNALSYVGYEAESGVPRVLCVDPPRGYGRRQRPSPSSQFISISPLEYDNARHDRICDLVWPSFGGKKNRAKVWRSQMASAETKEVTALYEHQREVLFPSSNAWARAGVLQYRLILLSGFNFAMQDFTCSYPVERLEAVLRSTDVGQSEMGLDGLDILEARSPQAPRSHTHGVRNRTPRGSRKA